MTSSPDELQQEAQCKCSANSCYTVSFGKSWEANSGKSVQVHYRYNSPLWLVEHTRCRVCPLCAATRTSHIPTLCLLSPVISFSYILLPREDPSYSWREGLSAVGDGEETVKHPVSEAAKSSSWYRRDHVHRGGEDSFGMALTCLQSWVSEEFGPSSNANHLTFLSSTSVRRNNSD